MQIKSINTILLTIIAASLCNNTYSQAISYNYIQGTYISTTIDLNIVEIDADGFAISGSFAVNNNLALTTSFGSTSYDRFVGIDLDTSELSFGFIAHAEISKNTDLFGGISIINSEIEVTDGFSTNSIDDTGNVLNLGIRSMASDKFELNFLLIRTDVFDETDTAFSFGAQFYANEILSIGANYITADNIESVVFNIRIGL